MVVYYWSSDSIHQIWFDIVGNVAALVSAAVWTICLCGVTIAWGLPPYVTYPDALINSAVECGRPHAIVAPFMFSLRRSRLGDRVTFNRWLISLYHSRSFAPPRRASYLFFYRIVFIFYHAGNKKNSFVRLSSVVEEHAWLNKSIRA